MTIISIIIRSDIILKKKMRVFIIFAAMIITCMGEIIIIITCVGRMMGEGVVAIFELDAAV